MTACHAVDTDSNSVLGVIFSLLYGKVLHRLLNEEPFTLLFKYWALYPSLICEIGPFLKER